MKVKLLPVVAALAVLTAGCGTTAPEATAPPELVLLTHDSFAVSEGILERFTADTGISVKVLEGGDAGTMVSQAVLTKDAPLADVMYGVDNTFLSRAVSAGIFVRYESSVAASLRPGLAAGPEVTPIDFGDVCINYSKDALETAGVAPPTSLTDLTTPAYRDMLVAENPATSSPGLAFLLSTIAAFPEDGEYTWRDYWADLRDNGVLVTPDWDSAYYGEFAGGGEGTRPLVVSYASSPPAGVIFSDPRPEVAPTGTMTEGCFRQIEYAGILSGTENEAAAGQLIDFLAGLEFQEDLPLNMFVFPANADAELPAEFIEHTSIPDEPAELDPAAIEANRERWIDEWTEVMRS